MLTTVETAASWAGVDESVPPFADGISPDLAVAPP